MGELYLFSVKKETMDCKLSQKLLKCSFLVGKNLYLKLSPIVLSLQIPINILAMIRILKIKFVVLPKHVVFLFQYEQDYVMQPFFAQLRPFYYSEQCLDFVIHWPNKIRIQLETYFVQQKNDFDQRNGKENRLAPVSCQF